MNNQKQNKTNKILLILPFILLIALMTICFGGGFLFLFYSVVCGIAFKSAMIILIVLGSGILLIGAGLGLILLYKKYRTVYDEKTGVKQATYTKPITKPNAKTSTTPKKTAKDYLTLPNIAIAVCVLGAIFAIISGALGCTSRDKWVQGTSAFKQENGYYDDIHSENLRYQIHAPSSDMSEIKEIRLHLIDKVAVVIYTDDNGKQGYITVNAYTKFVQQLVVSRSKDGTISIAENPSPERNDALDKLLFFIYNDFSIEKQVIIYVPNAYKNKIAIVGENVIYVDETQNG